MRAIFYRVFLVFFVVFFSLLLFELFLGIFGNFMNFNQKYKRDDLKWLSENVILNNFGYRDDNVSIIKKANSFRIYCLGDSYTFGWYINNIDSTYPRIIENNLQEKFGKEKIEVINAARPGFSLKESVDRFRNEGSLFGSDLVLIGINAYDLMSKEFPPQKILPLFSKLRIYELTFGSIERKIAREATEKHVKEVLKEGSDELKKVNLIVSELNSIVSQNGGKLAIVIFPNYNSANPNGEYQYYEFHSQMKNIADENNIMIVDPFNAFAEVNDKKNLVLNSTDPHPSILANEKTAEEILKTINFDQLINNSQLVTQSVKNALGSIDNNLINFHAIVAFINQENWVYFNRENKLGVQNNPLPSSGDRKSKYFVDYLKTVKSSTHEGWPGAKIEYNYPSNNKEIILPLKVYGYNIVGISQITAFYRERGNLISYDLKLEDLEIFKDKSQIYIKILKSGDFDYYRVNLDIETKQLDIESDKIVNVSQTKILSKKITNKDREIFFSLPSQATSLPKFYANGEGVNFAWLGGKMIPASIVQEDNGLKINAILTYGNELLLELPININLVDGDFEPVEFNYL